ncbi:MAG: hypothetical protein KAR40_04640 [Candidatus Sabulitectum sp.]|nr:hypothetical protein [Candidatus Sabulitectum sp.]
MNGNRSYRSELEQIYRIRDTISGVHPFLSHLYPLAIVENGEFLIFDTDESEECYLPAKRAPVPMPIPVGVRAAFDLECLDGRMACVVSGEVFDSLEGYATIFHEFIHCRQAETCEPQLKKRLRIAVEAADRGDFMWELNYPFPYESPEFTRLYRLFLKGLQPGDLETVRQCRQELSELLSDNDYEYLVWQEWKEGFARYIENLVRCRLGLSVIPGREDEQLDRKIFYQGGADFIEFLGKRNPFLTVEIDKLFDSMFVPFSASTDEVTSMEEFEEIISQARQAAIESGVEPKNIVDAIREIRSEKCKL